MSEERGHAGGHEKEDVEDERVADPVALLGSHPVHDERDEEQHGPQHGESPGMKQLDQLHDPPIRDGTPTPRTEEGDATMNLGTANG
jgi:hypothetical protein